jgi:ABC-2 type transport system ATP-binding protein
MAIEVNNITKEYGQQKALDGVSFSAGKGSITGFLGPNGAGKSTMMKILTCYIPQTAGSASVCGFDTAEASMEVRRRVGYLPEHNPLYTEMYISEFLEFAGGLYKIKNLKKRVGEMIELTGLGVERHKKISALSKGYRQRTGLAAALIHDPEVLILDEPTTGLDPNQLVEIRNLIKDLGREKTVLFSTHIMQEVEAVCDRAIFVKQGRIVADELLKDLGGEWRIRVEFSADVSRAELTKLKGVKSAEPELRGGWMIIPESHQDPRAEIFEFANKRGISILTLAKEQKSLEELFRSLTA